MVAAPGGAHATGRAGTKKGVSAGTIGVAVFVVAVLALALVTPLVAAGAGAAAAGGGRRDGGARRHPSDGDARDDLRQGSG